MLTRCFSLFSLLLLLVACGPKAKYSDAELAEQDAAWAKMMEGHDVVMPLMNDLYQASKQLKELAEDAAVEANDFHPRSQEALADIKQAEDAMMEWMNEIKDNQLTSIRERYEDHAAVMAFIDKEQTDIDQVAEDMQSSLAAAKALIQERMGN